MRPSFASHAIKLVALVAIISFPTSGNAQSVWKYMTRFDYGLSLDAFSLEYRLLEDPDDPDAGKDTGEGYTGSYSAQFGFNVPFKELSDRSSVGLNFGASVGLNAASIVISVPLIAQFKFNNDATWKGQSGMNVGFGVGAGVKAINLVSLIGFDGFTYFTPAVTAEVNLGEKKSALGIVKLRYTHNLGGYEVGNKNDPNAEYAIFKQAWSMAVLFTPNY